MHICIRGGYIVLRKPYCNYSLDGSTCDPRYGEKQGDVWYCGVDRMSWHDFDSIYYDGETNNFIRQTFDLLKSSIRVNSGYRLLTDYEVAKEVLAISNASTAVNDLYVLDCDLFQKNTIESKEIDWLGYDLDMIGYCSILRDGYFSYPDLFAEFSCQLNKYGLFDEVGDAIYNYIEKYKLVSSSDENGCFEPYTEVFEGVVPVRVGMIVT